MAVRGLHAHCRPGSAIALYSVFQDFDLLKETSLLAALIWGNWCYTNISRF